jgi:hypothetical protein
MTIIPKEQSGGGRRGLQLASSCFASSRGAKNRAPTERWGTLAPPAPVAGEGKGGHGAPALPPRPNPVQEEGKKQTVPGGREAYRQKDRGGERVKREGYGVLTHGGHGCRPAGRGRGRDAGGSSEGRSSQSRHTAALLLRNERMLLFLPPPALLPVPEFLSHSGVLSICEQWESARGVAAVAWLAGGRRSSPRERERE